ncbi:hypothetical protein [Paractinoplanes atraurantiacus]|uniref:Uncharacterized protein n=1 Tax=Paractinoplanes atraurantiacus TaxID=1036182 RepID=A0A285IHW4_9ACTN|nr:hypothetical protein [Actinoplanes atraurantiacus]SNY47568.1 hypothetical protein SAMN05421748_108165 [Actinoplanes atraurantiacus]
MPEIRPATFETVPEFVPAERPKRRWLVPAAVAVVAVVVAGVVVVSRPGDAAPEAVTAAVSPSFVNDSDRRSRLIDELLARRVAAFKAGDLKAWLADIDPAAAKAIAFETKRFANLRQFRFTSFDLSASNVTATAVFDEKPDVIIDQISRLTADVDRSVIPYNWKLEFTGDTVRITDVAPSYHQAYENPLLFPPFDDVPLKSASAGGITIAAAVGSKSNPQAFLPAAQRAAKLVRSLWGSRPYATPGFVIFLGDHKQFLKWYDNNAGRQGAVGVTVFPRPADEEGTEQFDRPNPTVMHKPNEPSWIRRGAGSRIVLDVSQFTSARQAESVMVHEMAHAIAPHLIQSKAGGYGPKATNVQATWPIEGFARWVEFLGTPGYAQSAMRTVRAGRAYRPAGPFPPSEGFYAADAKRQSYNYNLSSSMFLAAEQAGGRQKAVDLYVCLSNQMEYQADTEMFINTCISGVGLNPSTVWTAQRRLAGSQ